MISNDGTSPRQAAHVDSWWTLVELDLLGEPDSQQQVADSIAEALRGLESPVAYLKKLRSAMVRATLDALKHNRTHEPDAPTIVRVLVQKNSPPAHVADQARTASTQLRAAQREGQQGSPVRSHGWNFFMVEKTVQGPNHKAQRLIELFLYPAGEKRGAPGR